MSEIRILSRSDLDLAFPGTELIDAMDVAFKEVAAGEGSMPPTPIIVRTTERRGGLVIMPSYSPSWPALAAKVITVKPGNPARGLPYVSGLVALFDPESGALEAILDGEAVTSLRTAAASAAAVRALARAIGGPLAILGTGVQAHEHLAAIRRVRSVTEVRVSGRTLEAASRFAAREGGLGVPVKAVSTAEEAVRGAAIVVAATSSSTPVLKGEWLAPGSHVCAIGAYGPGNRELDSVVLSGASVVAVDTRPGCLEMADDIRIPISEGVLTEAGVVALGDVLRGVVPGRRGAEDKTVYKSGGMGALDTAAASVAVRRARVLGLGSTVNW